MHRSIHPSFHPFTDPLMAKLELKFPPAWGDQVKRRKVKSDQVFVSFARPPVCVCVSKAEPNSSRP